MPNLDKLALALCLALSPGLGMATLAKAKHRYHNYGTVTTTTYHVDGSKSTDTRYFDLGLYTATGQFKYLSAPPTTQDDCDDDGGDGGDGGDNPPPNNGNPIGNVPPADFPPPPANPSNDPNTVPPDQGTITVVQTYDGWTRTTTWNRNTSFVNGQWVDGNWGQPQVNGPVHSDGGHPDSSDCPPESDE